MSANSDMKIKVGIFFGGPSREREISFAGGRTVYDNLNKSIFEPLPIFVDSDRNFILLDWAYIYKGSIRDFFPPVESLPESPNAFQIYQESLGELSDAELDKLLNQVGQRIDASALPQMINVAFLALHGIYGEDGQIQQQLADLKIPYTGSGVAASQLGMDKARQKEVMGEKGFPCPKVITLTKSEWLDRGDTDYFEAAKEQIGYPMVIRPANQGSSIGVSIIQESGGARGFHQAMDQAFFRWRLPVLKWSGMSEEDKVGYVRDLTDIRHGLGFPLILKYQEHEATYYHPETLLSYLNSLPEESEGVALLEAQQSEEKVIIEEFINGKEFSCIVIRLEDGSSVALPPTEIIKGQELFDYRSKYMPGLSRKLTPIDLPDAKINAIRKECERLFVELDFQTYARIDGFITTEDSIFLNDPNTTSGMLPSSFFFHQAAEIGLNPSQFLTYIIRTSIQERIAEHQEKASYKALLAVVDDAIASLQNQQKERKRIGVVLGGYSAERHISVESGRNIFEKLASSEEYEAIPIFLTGSSEKYEFYQLPINLLLKDNADDIRDKIKTWKAHPIIEDIKQTCQTVTDKYASAEVIFTPQRLTLDQLAKKVDGVFIALHGRPGEDGQLQLQLDAKGVPYNGSGVKSSSLTINKHKTLQTLQANGFKVAGQLLLGKAIYESDPGSFYQEVEATFSYPFVAKPVDDGCSAAVKVLKNREQLEAFTRLIFRPKGTDDASSREALALQPQEEFPAKEEILFEQLITREEGVHFLEITGGLLTRYNEEGELTYEVFEPSETLSSGAVLSLEEKFLAGEGQNITPARFASTVASYESVATQVKADLEKAAQVLNVQGYARIDAFVRILADGTAETQIIEVNSLPGMTPATCIFHQAAAAGYKPYEFIDQILAFGFDKKNKTLAPPITPVAEEPADPAPDAAIAEGTEGEMEPVNSTITDDSGTSYISYADTAEDTPTETDAITVAEDETFLDKLKRLIVRPVWEFLKAPIFLKNLAAILGFILLLFVVTTAWLRMYTDHSESIQVEDYVGMTVEEAVRKAKSRSFKVVVDSLYVAGNKPNVIYSQTPEAFSRVKENRTIFMVRTTAKGVPIPFKPTTDDFQGAKSYLESRSIIVNEPKTIFNARRAEGTIVEATYKGKTYTISQLRKDGIEIYQGESIDFVVYTRVSDYVGLPNLVCRTFSEAEFLIQSRFLKMGVIHGNKQGSAYVYKQEPAYVPNQSIRKGTTISLFLTSSEPDDCE
ncbi:MAG: PASTA domain-containing protein [Saprospiraceae bacterium]|nr:PASTA domain-containing protein [Saprospiraceae bacterium]